jgi:hypothetical protein
MKIRHIILTLLASGTLLFASFIVPYDNSKPPAMQLPEAYRLAVTELGSSTNQFHCVGASMADFGPAGWYFTFCSTNTPPKNKWVKVEFGGKVYVEDILVR